MKYCRKELLKLYKNQLKTIENVDKKNLIERKFYNEKAKLFLSTLDKKQLVCSPLEGFPLRHRYFCSLFVDIKGKKVLDCGCGMGYYSVLCAKRGALVTAIDISEEMLKISKIRAKLNGVGNKIRFYCMSVERMSFTKEEKFDVVIGCGALHHFQLELAGKNISKTLKKGGKAIFLEPLIGSRFLFWFRSFFPVPCEESPGGGGLTYEEIAMFSKFFSKTSIKTFHFFTRLKLAKLEQVFEKIDSIMLWNFAFTKKLAGAVVIQCIR